MSQHFGMEQLAALVAQDPGAPEFSLLAELQRRAGQPGEARRVAEAGLAASPDSVAGRIVLALALLDLGETEAARSELVRGVEVLPSHAGLLSQGADAVWPEPPPTAESVVDAPGDHTFRGGVADDELDEAFRDAESITDEMHDVNRVAQAAILAEERAEAERAERRELDSLAEAEDFQPADHPAFATETMAGLLERQGDGQGAEAIRRALDRKRRDPDPERERVVVALESWLANIRRKFS